jgi:hypothetical protein
VQDSQPPLELKKTRSLSLSQEAHLTEDSPDMIMQKEQYCFQYYHKKYYKLRMQIIKDLFRSLTSEWYKKFVIYPLGSTEEIQHCISRFYYITYEVDAPIKFRYQHFINKYKNQNHYSLEQFIELDDLIKFNDREFQTYSSNATY